MTLLLAVALALGLSAASGLEPVVVPNRSILTPPVHQQIPLWYDSGNLVLADAGLLVGTVTGTSLAPLAGDGHRLIWRPTLAADVRVGDLLVADESDCPLGAKLAAHQVISITTSGGWEAQTMWPNGRHLLCKVKAERVKGIVVGVLW